MQPGDHFYLPQRGQLSSLYLPKPFHVPKDAKLRVIAFSFTAVLPLATAYQSTQVHPSFNAWALVATNTLLGTGDPAAGTFGFQFQMWHLAKGGQRQMLSTSLASQLICSSQLNNGAGAFLTEPELFLAGDSIRVQVKNLSRTTNDNMWVALWGGDVEGSF